MMKYKILAAFILLSLLAACGDKGAPPPQQAAAKPAEAKKQDAAPAAVTAEAAKPEYRYDPYNKPDPFEPFILATAETPLNPTQNRDISEFRLKGVVWNIKNPYALVEDPGGKGYIMKIGSKIGRNNGQIISINKGEIVVLETLFGLDGRPMKTNKISIKLPENK